MKKLIFASNNPHKIQEIRSLLKNEWELVTLQDAGIREDIPEPHNTLEENASEKSNTIYRLTGMDCFSEDTGLEVESLKGAPGVKSARYAGVGRAFDKNIEKLLQEMAPHNNRKARFRTVISLIREGKEYQFEGICPGRIAKTPRGESGFGYDPVFIPEGDNRSFAEMTMAEKNNFSHRKKAFDKLQNFLAGQ